MLDFLCNLLIGDAQPDAYVWASVLLAHALIGAALFITLGIAVGARLGHVWAGAIVVSIGYWGWETVQMFGGATLADSVLDWTGVTLGAVLARALWERQGRRAADAAGALFAVALAGVWARVRGR